MHHVAEQLVNVAGILADKNPSQSRIYGDLMNTSAMVSLADSDQTLICLNLDEDPGKRGEECGADMGDFQSDAFSELSFPNGRENGPG